MLHLNKKGLLKDHYHLWILNYVKLAIEDQVELSYYRSSIERVEIHGGLRHHMRITLIRLANQWCF